MCEDGLVLSSIAVSKCLTKDNLREGSSQCGSQCEDIVVGKTQGQECGAAGHIAPADKNQREDRGRL